jgi:MFS family permease
VLPIGLYLRRKLPETITHTERVAVEEDGPPPRIGRILLVGFLLIASNSVTLYTLQFIGTYSMAVLRLSPFVAFLMTSIIGITLFVFALAGGALSDRMGRRPFLLWPRALLLIAAWPAFALVTAGPTVAKLAIVTFLLTACFGLFTAAANVALAEILPKARRSSGYALTYTMGVTVFGGSAQFVVAWLTKSTGSAMVPAYALLGASIVGLVAGLLMPLRRHDRPEATPKGLSPRIHHA